MSQQDSYGPSDPSPAPAPPPYPPDGYGQAGPAGPGPDQPAYNRPGRVQPAYGEPAHGQPGHDQHGYGQPGYDQPYGAPGYPQRTNVMAILGLVFAFLFSPLGLVFSAVGLRQVRKRSEKGRGLALSGLILSIVFLLIGVLLTVVVLPAVKTAVDAAKAGTVRSSAPADTGATAGAGSGAADDHGVRAACQTIVPALLQLGTDLKGVSTPDEYSQALSKLEGTLTSAASGTSDPQFQQHVAQINTDLEKASANVQNGKDASSLVSALNADGEAIDTDCGNAGFTD